MDFFVFISEQWVLVSVFMVLLYAFAWTERAKGGNPLNAAELVRLMNADEAVLIDVRDAAEFQGGHIAGAVHLPYNKIAGRISELGKYREKTIVLADKMGQHAGAVGKILSKDGYKVRRLSGGMSEWQNQNLPTVKGSKSAK